MVERERGTINAGREEISPAQRAIDSIGAREGLGAKGGIFAHHRVLNAEPRPPQHAKLEGSERHGTPEGLLQSSLDATAVTLRAKEARHEPGRDDH